MKNTEPLRGYNPDYAIYPIYMCPSETKKG